MEIKTIFLIFGIGLAVYAVLVSFAGLKVKDFPSRGALIGLIAIGVILVAGTTTFAVKLSVEEAEEREHGEHVIGEETTEAALTAPVKIPARLA